MKKVFLVVLIFTLCLTSCRKKEEPIFDNFMQDYVTSNKLDLDVLLTVSYSIDELTNYFGTVNENEFALQDVESSIVYRTLLETNEKFPIQSFRNENQDNWYYTVYQVSEGGLYYVFWGQVISYTTTSEGDKYATSPDWKNPEDFGLYFTAYLPDSKAIKTKRDFDVLEIGISTAEDVFAVDSNMELTFSRSHGIFSYSLLKNGSIMEVEYYWPQNGANNRSELIVKDLRVYKENIMGCCLGDVLKKDLPK